MTGGNPGAEADAWTAREHYWRKKLHRRIRFGAEPIERQLAQRLRAMLALSAILAAIGSMFFLIFAAFGRVDVGLAVAALLLAPVAAWAWLDFAWLRHRALCYVRERDAFGSDARAK